MSFDKLLSWHFSDISPDGLKNPMENFEHLASYPYGNEQSLCVRRGYPSFPRPQLVGRGLDASSRQPHFAVSVSWALLSVSHASLDPTPNEGD